MNLLLRRVVHYGFNAKILDFNTFHDICYLEGITIKEKQDFTAYFVIDGIPYIALRKSLRHRKTYEAFHELTHYFWHTALQPNQLKFLSGVKTKEEMEADMLSIIALCPIGVLKGEIEFPLETNFDRWVIEERKRIYFLYNM